MPQDAPSIIAHSPAAADTSEPDAQPHFTAILPPPSRDMSRWIVVSVLSALTLLLVVARIHTYSEPLERDITSYAVYGHELLNGRKLYTDIWDHKPPLQFITLAVAELITGYGRQEIYFLNVVEGTVILLGLYCAGKAIGGRGGGLASAAIWALGGGSLQLQGNQPNTELGINAWTIWAIAVFWADRGEGRGLRRAAIAGILFTVASMFKHVVVLVPMMMCVAWIIDPPRGKRMRALMQSLVIGGIGIAGWGLLFAYFGLTHRAAITYDSLFTENTSYAGSMRENLGIGLSMPYLFPMPHMKTLLPAILAAAVMAVVAAVVRIRNLLQAAKHTDAGSMGSIVDLPGSTRWPLSIHAIAVIISTWASVVLPGKYYPHYYQLWLMPICLAGGWALAVSAKMLSSIVRHRPADSVQKAVAIALGSVPALMVLIAITVLEAPYYALPANEWSRIKYGGIFIAEAEAAEQAQKLLLPDETLYNFGNEMGLYFYTKRRPPVGQMSSYLLHDNPLADHFNDQVFHQLLADPPELLVITHDQLDTWVNENLVFQWLQRHYRVIPGQSPNRLLTLACLNDGKLEKRLGLKPGSQ